MVNSLKLRAFKLTLDAGYL